MNTARRTIRRPQRGYALVTAIVFLVLLTIVALAAIRGTGLELKSTANNTLRAEAFAASEIARTITTQQIAALCDNSLLAVPAVVGWTKLDSANWCTESETGEATAFASDARYAITTPIAVNGEVSVRRLYNSPAPGAGQAQGAGYASAGVGAAAGGGNIYFLVQSRGSDRPSADDAQAGYNTSSIYRYVIRR
ncbi:PilX N-terminal domain-containing pilus assembly protein [Nevskia sp.]|uniref:pilus assembly PilX family protein n=1 Tax=Nevskia sp. TaxID=1929292 RepID=UPI0025F4E402|nr:PilX N-terminal domain-containing pilus assembly protein [Nevskia sp.]